YRDAMAEAAIDSVEYEILSSLESDTISAQVSYEIKLHSVLVGDIQRDTTMNLSLVDGAWRVQWAENLILPELAGGNTLWMDRHVPARANIYDRYENPIVGYAQAVSVGIVPGHIAPSQEEDFLEELQWLTGLRPNAIAAMYQDYPLGSDWYLPLGEALYEKVDGYYNIENGYSNDVLYMYPYETRYYYNGGIAPQAIGYVSRIQADEQEILLRQGYSRDEMIGRQGIEKWGAGYLTGERGGTLYVIDPDNNVVTQLANAPAQPSQPIYTTLDADFQLAAQTALIKYGGAIVVMEVDTGRVLAMASSPWYDPNAFDPNNYNSGPWLEDIYSDYSGQPMLNRATQGQYPLGSVFKIITMAAALESGLYTKETIYDCQYEFTEVAGISPRYDWTWDHCQQELNEEGECKTKPSGELTLPEGLMRSCNPYFWHIGLDLYRQGLVDAVSEMARAFGLGSLTGIEGVEEEPGAIPDPKDEIAAINGAIGQGETLVTPLQVAQFVAAIGNGGTIYQPQIIERISLPGEEPVFEFEPIVSGELPLSPGNLETIQQAMVSVVENRRGTAYYVMGAYSSNIVPIAGKTGTAESGGGKAHAWFVGYTDENRSDKPDIAIAVIGEYAGEGSEVAAPIFRAMVQQYFEGRRTYLLPWESSVGVIAIPEPEEEATPES
ncbi:MAG: penicillin-binding transpeptidase domain-containing protein, partial [Chloroflexota bacterium]|nr:penicillin-binding transpeptidase domain-containing protein [Chloroflexota bacterium]